MAELKTTHVLNQVERDYFDKQKFYEQLSNYVLDRLQQYKRTSPKAVRIIFSREPKLKTLESVSQKIAFLQKDIPTFSLKDLTDVVAMTVLCAYASDIPPFLKWLRNAFDVTPDNEAAFRSYDSGHRGYHFNLRLTLFELDIHPELDEMACELQVKTLAQEVFDAKSHDLAYKPGYLKVSSELKNQFSILSSALDAIDRQSEFLKNLLLHEQQDLDLRKAACLELYLGDYGDVPVRLGLDPSKLPQSALQVLTVLKNGAHLLSPEFCRFAAYCALKLDNALLKKKTLEWADNFVSAHLTEPKCFGIRGTIRWVLGCYEDAFQDMEQIISWNGPDLPDSTRLMRAKNNLVYYVCDMMLFQHHVHDHWVSKAAQYVKDLRKEAPSEADTIGFYMVIFGTSSEEVEEGRDLLKNSRKERERSEHKDYEAFFSLHDHVALTKLLELSRQNLTKP